MNMSGVSRGSRHFMERQKFKTAVLPVLPRVRKCWTFTQKLQYLAANSSHGDMPNISSRQYVTIWIPKKQLTEVLNTHTVNGPLEFIRVREWLKNTQWQIPTYNLGSSFANLHPDCTYKTCSSTDALPAIISKSNLDLNLISESLQVNHSHWLWCTVRMN